MEIYLVDGTYELFRSYYGAPKFRNKLGYEVGAAKGFLNSMLALLRDKRVTHVACAFDHVIESFRNKIFSGYKTGDGIDSELLAQFSLAEEVAQALGVVVWPMVSFEADDAIATAVARFSRKKEVERIVIASPDKDLTQCVCKERIVCLDRRRQIVLDEAGVQEKFGVLPGSIPDYLALVGDAADGIPGILGWGEKSTAQVVSSYGSIDRIPEDSKSWDVSPRRAKFLAENLRNNRNEALLYKNLATLRTDVPLDEELEQLKWLGAVKTRIDRLVEEFEDAAIANRIFLYQD